MLTMTKFFEKTFKTENGSLKDAYFKASEWYGHYVLANPNLKNVKASYEKLEDEKEIKLTLYCGIDSNSVFDKHCKTCKEFHCKVFTNEFYNCNICNAKAMDKLIKDKLAISKKYFKETLERK